MIIRSRGGVGRLVDLQSVQTKMHCNEEQSDGDSLLWCTLRVWLRREETEKDC